MENVSMNVLDKNILILRPKYVNGKIHYVKTMIRSIKSVQNVSILILHWSCLITKKLVCFPVLMASQKHLMKIIHKLNVISLARLNVYSVKYFKHVSSVRQDYWSCQIIITLVLNNVQMDLPLTLFNVSLVLLDVKDVSIAGNASNVLVRIKVGPFIFIMEIV